MNRSQWTAIAGCLLVGAVLLLAGKLGDNLPDLLRGVTGGLLAVLAVRCTVRAARTEDREKVGR